MKKLDLTALGVEEMNDAQMQEVDGGIWLALALALAYDIVSNWDDSADNFNKGRSSARELMAR